MNTFGLKYCLPFSFCCLAAMTLGARPATAQVSIADANSVFIISTGYGVLPGYQIEVSPKGLLSSSWQPRFNAKPIVRTDQLTNLNRQQLFRDLGKAGALAALPTGNGQIAVTGRRGRRGRNAPPTVVSDVTGPQIFVLYHGQQTPNLRVASTTAGKTLYQDVKKIMQVLRLPIPNFP